MKRVNLSDLSDDIISDDKAIANDHKLDLSVSATVSDDKTNETIEEEGGDGDRGNAVDFERFMDDGIRGIGNMQIDENQTEWKQHEDDDDEGLINEGLIDGDELRRRRHIVESNDANHSYGFRMKDTPRVTFSRTSHRDLKNVRTKNFY